MRYLTLSKTNQFQFTCPIFEVDTKMSHCVQIRDVAYLGGAPLPVRKGCQACVRDGKCPAAEIVRRLAFGRVKTDDYGSTTPLKGKIQKDVLERVANVIVMEKTMSEYGVTDAERIKIETSSDRIRKMIGDAPTTSSVTSRRAAPAKKATPPAKSTSINPVNRAAATGDLAAAISI